MTLLPARPAERTSRIFSGATPPLEPRTSASLTASMVSATTTWLAALVTWPAPVGPTWFTVAPHHLKERPRALEVLLASPHHDGERPLYGTDVSAANRGVEHGSPALFDLRCQLLGHNGGDGAHVNEERTFLDPLQHPALAGDHITHVR